MKNQKIILNRLLNKYENSKHLLNPGTSLRRVMLKVEKKDFPEYIYEDAVIRDAYNEAALELEKKHLVQLEWVKGRPVLSAIVLRLDQISQCYAFAERMHPKVRASQIIQLIDGGLKDVAIPWIIAWKVDVCRSAAEQLKIPVFCKTDDIAGFELAWKLSVELNHYENERSVSCQTAMGSGARFASKEEEK